MTDDLVKRFKWPEPHCGRLGCLEPEQAQQMRDRIEALTARLQDMQGHIDHADAYHKAMEAAEAERDRLREAAIALRDDMMERARIKIDVVNGEEYRIVNAGRGAWENFCAALKGRTE